MAEEPLQPHLQQGIAHHRAGRLAEAQSAYHEVLRISPEQPEALYMLGTALGQAGREADAEPMLARAVALRPGAGYELTWALTLHALGRRVEALAAFHAMIKARPAMAEAHYFLGNALHEAGRMTEAALAYREAARLQPRDPLIWNNLGAALQATGQLPGAVDAYRRAIALNPQDAMAWTNLSGALTHANDFAGAIAAAREAARLQPNNAGAHANLAAAFTVTGALDDAIAEYRTALRLDPNYAEAHNNLGYALKDTGAIPQAIAEYQEALRLNPGYVAAHDNLLHAMLFDPVVNDAAMAAELARWDQQHVQQNFAGSGSMRPEVRSRGERGGMGGERGGGGCGSGMSHPIFARMWSGDISWASLREQDRGAFEVFCYATMCCMPTR